MGAGWGSVGERATGRAAPEMARERQRISHAREHETELLKSFTSVPFAEGMSCQSHSHSDLRRLGKVL